MSVGFGLSLKACLVKPCLKSLEKSVTRGDLPLGLELLIKLLYDTSKVLLVS